MADESWWESFPVAGKSPGAGGDNWWEAYAPVDPPKATAKKSGGPIELLADFGKRIGGSAINGIASTPQGVQAGMRATVRQGAGGDPSTVMPASVFMPGIDTDEAINGPMTDAQRGQRELGAERLAAGVRLPGAATAAKVGSDVQQRINASTSQATQDAVANSQITGNLLKGEIDFGKDPSVRGILMQGADVVGSMFPVVATALVTRSPSAAGAVGGAMAAGEGVSNARDYVAKMTEEQLQEHSPMYRRLVDAGASPVEARQLVSVRAEDTSALLQGAVAAAGDRFTGSLVTGGLDKMISRVAGKSVVGRAAAGGALSSLEEGTQELAEGVASDIGTKSVVTNKEIGEGSAANFVLGALGGGAPGAVRGAVARGTSGATPTPAAQAAAETTLVQPDGRPGSEAAPASAADQTPVGQAPDGQPSAQLEQLADEQRMQQPDGAPDAMDGATASMRLAELEVISASVGLNPEQQTERAALVERVDAQAARELEQETLGESAESLAEGDPQADAGAAPAFDPAAVKAKNWLQFVAERGHKLHTLSKGTPIWNALRNEWDSVRTLRAGTNPEGTGSVGAPTPEIQNRDRARPASVVQMQGMAQNPDYMRLGVSRSPESGAPMVFAVGDQVQAAHMLGSADVAVMSDGQRVPFQYGVMEAADVQPSNFADGNANPMFDSAHPGVVKALNNGRTAGLRAAYERGTADNYRRELVADSAMHGIDAAVIEGMKAPVLVRLYSEKNNQANMGAKSQSQALGLSATEQAATDATLMDAATLDVFDSGELDSASNRDFARAFIGKLQAEGQDVAGMMDASGALSPAGVTRLQAALVHKAYGDGDLVESMFGSTDNDIRAIGESLKAVAGEWANMRHAAEVGAINPEVDVTGSLLQAIRLVQKARRERASLYDAINQVDMETGDVVDPLTVGMLRMLYSGHYLTRALGRDRVVDSLRQYLAASLATRAEGDMFGEQVGPAAILSALNGQPTQQNNDTRTQNPNQPAPDATQGERSAPGGNPPGGRPDEPGSEAQRPRPGGAGQDAVESGGRSEGQDAQDPGRQQNGQSDQGPGQDSSGPVGANYLIEETKLGQRTSFDVVERSAEFDEAVFSAFTREEAQAWIDAKSGESVPSRHSTPSEEPAPAQDAQAEAGTELPSSDAAASRPAAAIESAAFKKWFGDSKVVDEQGSPLVMFHGTSASQDGQAFSMFDTYASNYGLMGMGGYFTADPDVASSYTSKGKGATPTVYPAYLTIKNPLDMDAEAPVDAWLKQFPDAGSFHEGGSTNESWYRAAEEALSEEGLPKWEGAEVMQDSLRAMGFDGITHVGGGRVKSDGVKHRVFIAFDPEQIKSATGNNGEFDGSNPDIRYRRGDQDGAADPTAAAGMTPEQAEQLLRIMGQAPQPSHAAKAEAVNKVRATVDAIRAAWANGPEVIVAHDMSDAAIPRAARLADDAQRSGGAVGNPEGFYYGGKVYLLASQLPTPQDAARVLMHEALGHHGLRGVFGKDLDGVLEQIAAVRRDDVRRKAAEYGLDFESGAQRLQAAEEVLAEWAQSRPEMGYVRRAVAAIRTWVRRHVPGMRGRTFTDDEIIRSYILPARGWVERGAGSAATAQAAPAYSRSDKGEAMIPDAIIGSTLGTASSHPDYPAAKAGDSEAAMRLALDLVTPEMVAKVQARLGDARPRVLPVTAEEAAGRNKIPMAVSVVLADRMGLDVDAGVVQANRAHRTGMDGLDRLFAPVDFAGTVEPGEYLLVDDTLTQGGTFAALASHIREGGGKVAGIVALTGKQYSAKIQPSPEILTSLRQKHGDLENEFRAATGYGFDALTESEARYLARYEPAQRLRDRIAAEGRRGRERANESDPGPGQVADDGPRFSRGPGTSNPASPGAAAPQTKLAQLHAKVKELTSRKAVDSWLYDWQDRFIDLKRIQENIKALNGTVSETNDAYRGEELYHKRVAKRTSNFLRDEVRPLLKAMNEAKVRIPELESFLHARHAPEANRVMAERNPNKLQLDAKRAKAEKAVTELRLQLQRANAARTSTVALQKALGMALMEKDKWGRSEAFRGTEDERLSLSGMSDLEAKSIMASYSPAKRKALEALTAQVDKINAGTLETLESYGLMDGATLDAWRKTYEHYVPLHRDEAHEESKAHPIGQGFSTKGDASKQRTGSNEKVTNILGHIMMQRETALTRGEKNNVAKRLYVLAAQNPDDNVWSLDLPKKKIVDPDTGLVKTVVDQGKKDNVVMVRIGGKDKPIIFNEHNERAVRLALAIKNMDAMDLDWLTKTMGHITRWFAAVNTQYNPVFGVMNFARDVQGSMLQLSTTPLAGQQAEVFRNIRKNSLAIWSDLRRERTEAGAGKGQWAQLWEQMQLDGGTTGYRDLYADPKDRAKALQKALDQQGQGKTAAAGRALMGVLSDFNETLEATTRLAVYKAALDHGQSRDSAASIAKNITVNFNRRGKRVAVLGHHYAFMNAAIQGNKRLLETLAGPTGRKVMIGGVLLGMMSGMAGALMMGGGGADDEWKKIPEFTKERSLIIPLGREDYVAVPMPLGFHVFPNIGRKMVDFAMHDDPTKNRGGHLVDLALIALNAYNPLGGSENISQMLTPTWLDPVVALWTNTDWTGKSIYREDRSQQDPKPGFTRAKDSTAAPYRWIAELANSATGGNEWRPGGFSPTPEAIEYMVEQFTGGVGRELNKVGAMSTAAVTGEELAAHQLVLVGRIYGNTRGVNGESPAYYENIRRINTSSSEAKGRSERGEDVGAILEDVPLAKLDGAAGVFDKRVSDLVKARRKIQASDNPNKRDLVKEINKEIEASMYQLNKAVHDTLEMQ